MTVANVNEKVDIKEGMLRQVAEILTIVEHFPNRLWELAFGKAEERVGGRLG